MSRRTMNILGLAVFAAATAHAGDAANPETEQRLRQDMQVMLSQLAASGALGDHPESLNVQLDQPAQRVMNLGALVDSATAEKARDGLRVLGTLPGSIGEQLGLRPGDVIVAVNGTSLRGLGADANGHALAASTLKSTVEALPDAAPLQLDVRRGGEAIALNAPVRGVYLPALHVQIGAAALASTDNTAASGGCGRISTWDLAPPGEHQYHARILLLDGVTPGPSGGETYRVSAGTHKLLVAEDIPIRQFGVGSDFASLRRDTHKEFTITVKPNTTSMVAAHLLLDKANNVTRGNYWEPVVWREIPLGCP